MEIWKYENYAEFDCDDTLVMWSGNHNQPGVGKVAIPCPYEEGRTFYLYVHDQHVNLLIAQKKRGYQVIVHSQGGWAWAEAVIKALALEQYVDVVKTKTQKYIDDLPADSWKSRVYLKFNSPEEK